MVQRIHSKLQSKWQHTLTFPFEEKELGKLQLSVWADQVNRCKMFLIRSRDEYIYTRFDWNRRQRSLDGKEEDQLARESINNFYFIFFFPPSWTLDTEKPTLNSLDITTHMHSPPLPCYTLPKGYLTNAYKINRKSKSNIFSVRAHTACCRSCRPFGKHRGCRGAAAPATLFQQHQRYEDLGRN